MLPRGVRERDRDESEIDTMAAELRRERLVRSPGRARGDEARMLDSGGRKSGSDVGDDSWGERTGLATPPFGSIMFGATGDEPGRPTAWDCGEKPKTVVGVVVREGIRWGTGWPAGDESSSMLLV